MRRICKTAGMVLACLALFNATGLHLAALQVIAWGGMIITYSARSGLETGLRETFDGDHPCPLCLTLEKVKAEPRVRDAWTAPNPPVCLIAVPAARAEAVYPSFTFCPARFITVEVSGCWPDPPPLPPPKPLLPG